MACLPSPACWQQPGRWAAAESVVGPCVGRVRHSRAFLDPVQRISTRSYVSQCQLIYSVITTAISLILGLFPAEILLLMCFCHIKHHRDVAVFCHDFSFSRHIYSLLDACSLAQNSRQKKTLLYKYIDIPKGSFINDVIPEERKGEPQKVK